MLTKEKYLAKQETTKRIAELWYKIRNNKNEVQRYSNSTPTIILDKWKQPTIQFKKSNTTTTPSSSTSNTTLISDVPPISVHTSSASSKIIDQTAVSTTVALPNACDAFVDRQVHLAESSGKQGNLGHFLLVYF